MTDDRDLALAELSQLIARDVLTMPELAAPDWDTYAMAVEVTDDSVAVTAYRYPAVGDPVSTEEPEDIDVFWDLRDRTRGRDGRAWDVVIVKIRRDPADLVLTFHTGADADRWGITPQNMAHLPESLRPRPEDFASG